MNTFLEDFVDILWKKYKKIDQLTIVFPNRRAGLFFKKHLAQKIEKPIWAPEILSIQDFIQNHSSLKLAEKLELIFELFYQYQKISATKQSFEDFYYWGEMLLQDFDEIDKYLIDPKNIFTKVEQQKTIDQQFDFLTDKQKKLIQQFWKTFEPTPSTHQEDFLKVWEILYSLYQAYQNVLKEKSIAYEGMIYRDAVNNLTKNKAVKAYTLPIFAGFNALTKAENIIFEWYIQHTSAEVYWDLDQYYVENYMHDAGTFLREYKQSTHFRRFFPDPLPNHFNSPKNIQVTGIASLTGQAKMLGQTLQSIIKENNASIQTEKTAIVLPDEQMLFPVLHALPDTIKHYNITMGYPLKHTQIYQLIKQILQLQIHLETDSMSIPYRLIETLLKNPYIYFYNVELAKKNLTLIQQANKTFIMLDDILLDNNLYPLLFKKFENPQNTINYILAIVQTLYEYEKENEENSYTLEESYFFLCYTHLNQLQQLVSKQTVELNTKVFLKLLQQIFQSLSLPFTGEPLEGLQIMGMLETRCLDFENVFVLNLNESILPRKPRAHSFIPYNLRKAFELPTVDQQDALQSYLFYRLLQRAKNIHLFYHTEITSENQGEMSRYILQLLYDNDIKVKHKISSHNIVIQSPKPISINKTPSIQKKLIDFFNNKKRLTPSAINTYLDCRLRFYFRYVVEIYEPQQVQEQIDPMNFGILMHNTLENLYSPFISKNEEIIVTKQMIKELHGQIEKATLNAIRSFYKLPKHKHINLQGQLLIIKKVIHQFTTQLVYLDEKYAPFKILGLEMGINKDLSMPIKIHVNKQQKTVTCYGIIDRVDKKDDKIRIIDYKTGSDTSSFKDLASLFDRNNTQRNKAAFQILFYTLLFYQNIDQNNILQPTLINVRNLFQENINFTLNTKPEEQKTYTNIIDARPMFDDLKKHIVEVVEEIFDYNTAFDQTDDEKKCKQCPYNKICFR